jgi:signal transduction histidine kinase/HAMP domain-containing protein
MSQVSNSIAVKLVGGFGVCVLLMAALVGFNFSELQRLEKLFQETENHSTAMEMAKDAQHIGQDLGVIIGHSVIVRNLAESEKEWVVAKKRNLTKLQELITVAEVPEEQAIIRGAQATLHELIRTYETEMLPLVRKGESIPGILTEVNARLDARIADIEHALEQVAKIESDENIAAAREFHVVLLHMIRSGLAMSLAGVMVAIFIAAVTTRRIVRPLHEMTSAALEMEKGNYLIELKHRSADEIGVLANAFRDMAGQVEKRKVELEDSNEKLRHEIVERKLAEDEIRRLNIGLEQRVAERTAELAANVSLLRQEAAERSRAEEALKQSEELLRVVFEILPVGIWVAGRGGECIVKSNRAGKLIWCGDPDCDLEKMTGFKGWLPGTGTRLRKEDWALARALNGGETTLNEVVEIECFNGTRKTIANSAVPILNSDNEIIAAVEVIEDITERYRAGETLKASHAQLRFLSARLDEVLEEERGKIAREIHDELGQQLTVLKFDLSWLKGKMRAEQPALAERIESMDDLIDMTIETVQRIATDLRPGILDHLGLSAAIEWYVQNFQKRTGIDCHLKIGRGEIPGDQRLATALFRICQEALTNVMRHADASRVDVTIDRKGSSVHLEITDNGKGVSREELVNPASVGLTGMRERTRLLGGNIKISGVQGKGTKVKVTIPVVDKEESSDQNSHSG